LARARRPVDREARRLQAQVRAQVRPGDARARNRHGAEQARRGSVNRPPFPRPPGHQRDHRQQQGAEPSPSRGPAACTTA
jgi:hypothetical protein